MEATDVTSGAETRGHVSAGAFQVSFASFAPSVSIDSHYHEQACVSVLIEGRFEQRFRGRSCDCPPGVVLSKPAGERHIDRWFDARSRHLIVEIDSDRYEDLGTARPVAEQIFHVGDIGAEALAWAAWREWLDADSLTPVALEGLILQLLARVQRRGSAEVRGGAPTWLTRVREYLHDNFASRIRLSEVSQIAGVHRDHLSRVFVDTHGVSVAGYVRDLRVQAVRRSLATTDDTLSAIAYRYGFSDQSHMTRVFKQAVGVTPGRYRASCRGLGML